MRVRPNDLHCWKSLDGLTVGMDVHPAQVCRLLHSFQVEGDLFESPQLPGHWRERVEKPAQRVLAAPGSAA